MPGLSQLDFAVDLVGEADAAERHRRAGGEGLIALEPALRKGLADRLFDLAQSAQFVKSVRPFSAISTSKPSNNPNRSFSV